TDIKSLPFLVSKKWEAVHIPMRAFFMFAEANGACNSLAVHAMQNAASRLRLLDAALRQTRVGATS
ncbi:hypothetical protein, partial [uncultured Senegalimassilia sp.]|uniref:hypothetical protein n=1 Tax=uncultured Senegalimassilia sp. TaxID=1714350 RepID=UPI0026754349